MKPSRTTAFTLALSFVSLGLVAGCNKLKSLKGGGDDAGAATASGGGGGGILGLLKPSPMEGAVEVAIEDKRKPGDVTNLHVEIKPEKVRIDFPTPAPGKKSELDAFGTGYAIIKSAEKKVFVVLDKSKQVVVIDLDKPMTPPGAPAGAGKPSVGTTPVKDNTKVTKTGKTETVAGHECEDWDIQSETGGKATICMAKSFSFMSLPGLSGFGSMMPGGGGEMGLMAQVFSGSLPLKFVGYDKAGAVTTEAKATKIDKRSIDESRFTPPPGYTNVTIEQMMAGMMQMQRPAAGRVHR